MAKKTAVASTTIDAQEVVATLRGMAKKSVKDGMARFAIPSDNAFGVTVGEMRALAKKLGRNHQLALDLWKTGWYEARMTACFVDDPILVTPAQMDRWCNDFDSWAIVDSACFHLFDRTPYAWDKVNAWAGRKKEFVKRAAFALIASLSVHDKKADDALFADALKLIEQASDDDRNFVKKAVNWALRCIGKRSRALNAAAVAVSERLAASTDSTPRWIGKDALRELQSASVARRLKR
jgi:3-methyladenine DNA glycosylase AlkD